MNDFPKILTTASKQSKHQNYQFVIDNFREKADAIYSEYTLQFSHKTTTDVADHTRNFLFQDYQFRSILDGYTSYVTTTSDKKNRINSIGYFPNKSDDEKNNIQAMLSNIRGFILYFQNGIYMLATNYKQCKSERRKNGDDEFSLESANSVFCFSEV